MDNVTHGLWGLGIYGAWLAVQPQPTVHGLAAAVCTAAIVGSEAPDFDYAVRLTRGPVSYLRQHRAFSHSLPMWIGWPLVIAAIISLFEPGHFALLFTISLIAVVFHVLLDVMTSYGTQAFWPISKRRFGLDALFIIDPVMLIAGFLGWYLSGSGRWDTAQAVFVLAFIVFAYIALRAVWAGFLNDRVRRQFPAAWRISVLPGMLPWWWSFVAQSEKEVMVGSISWNGEVSRDIHWRWPERDERILERALTESRLGRVYGWFCRHLTWTVRETATERRVILVEAMYRQGIRFPFAAVIVFSKEDERLLGDQQQLELEDLQALMGHASVRTKHGQKSSESFS